MTKMLSAVTLGKKGGWAYIRGWAYYRASTVLIIIIIIIIIYCAILIFMILIMAKYGENFEYILQ